MGLCGLPEESHMDIKSIARTYTHIQAKLSIRNKKATTATESDTGVKASGLFDRNVNITEMSEEKQSGTRSSFVSQLAVHERNF